MGHEAHASRRSLPSGGPSPPLAARLRADLVGAVFDGDAAGPGPKDPQLRDRYGLNFRVNDPPLLLGEAQFLWNAKKAILDWTESSSSPAGAILAISATSALVPRG